MRAARQWEQILLGIGLGLLLGAVSQFFRQQSQPAAILLGIAAVCIFGGFYLMRR